MDLLSVLVLSENLPVFGFIKMKDSLYYGFWKKKKSKKKASKQPQFYRESIISELTDFFFIHEKKFRNCSSW